MLTFFFHYSPHSKNNSGDCDLSCWIGNLTITFGRYGIINSILCYNIELNSIQSQFIPPFTVSLFTQLQLQCNVKFGSVDSIKGKNIYILTNIHTKYKQRNKLLSLFDGKMSLFDLKMSLFD